MVFFELAQSWYVSIVILTISWLPGHNVYSFFVLWRPCLFVWLAMRACLYVFGLALWVNQHNPPGMRCWQALWVWMVIVLEMTCVLIEISCQLWCHLPHWHHVASNVFRGMLSNMFFSSWIFVWTGHTYKSILIGCSGLSVLQSMGQLIC